METRHAFLAGASGGSKIMFIRQMLEKLQLDGAQVSDFYTSEIRSGGRRMGFRVVTLDSQEAVLVHVDVRSKRRVSRTARTNFYQVLTFLLPCSNLCLL